MSYYEDIRLVAIKLGRCLRIPKEPWYQPQEFFFTACTRTFQDVSARLSAVKEGTTPDDLLCNNFDLFNNRKANNLICER